jgi:hypothetical protein
MRVLGDEIGWKRMRHSEAWRMAISYYGED